MSQKNAEIKLFKNLKDIGPKLVVCNLDDFSENEEEIRGYLLGTERTQNA